MAERREGEGIEYWEGHDKYGQLIDVEPKVGKTVAETWAPILEQGYGYGLGAKGSGVDIDCSGAMCKVVESQYPGSGQTLADLKISSGEFSSQDEEWLKAMSKKELYAEFFHSSDFPRLWRGTGGEDIYSSKGEDEFDPSLIKSKDIVYWEPTEKHKIGHVGQLAWEDEELYLYESSASGKRGPKRTLFSERMEAIGDRPFEIGRMPEKKKIAGIEEGSEIAMAQMLRDNNPLAQNR